jgi:8-oxo-dGTP diphosphatase
MNRWQERFPKLFARSAFEWGGVASGDLEIQFSLELPPDELVSNVKVIGRVDGGVVVCESDQGWRFLPGGTRESGEAVTETARRELLEEAGASIVGSLDWIGAFEVNNPRSSPYRPHLLDEPGVACSVNLTVRVPFVRSSRLACWSTGPRCGPTDDSSAPCWFAYAEDRLTGRLPPCGN